MSVINSNDPVITGTPGADNVVAGDGDNVISTGSGNDTINAGGGNDTVYAGNNQDVVNGGAGDDKLYGQGSNDTLIGGTGDDYIDGGIGDDNLLGGPGSDILFGGKGDDVLRGGGGNQGDGVVDYFVFGNDDGNDRVFKFEVGIDKIVLIETGDLSFSYKNGSTIMSYGDTKVLFINTIVTADDIGFIPDTHVHADLIA